MGDFFANLRSGVQFPQVVMNQGPLPGSGGLPRPLHDTADSRINYNSSLLGNIAPYAYGEPGYLSSQTAYLNIPHKIQKHVPLVFLPEPRPSTSEFFDLSHAVDDGDLVFTLRLARNSLFCTGKKDFGRGGGLGTRIDPLVNLATVNYILSGLQLGLPDDLNASTGDLWSEFLFNLDPRRFGRSAGGLGGRNYSVTPFHLGDIVHIVRHCIRPFGIARGSEKQGGQNEVGIGPSTWPVGFMVSVTIDGKESNVLNLWHHVDMSAGDDLALSLKLMPVRQYTLNHYFEGFKRKTWASDIGRPETYVWQLVPTLAHLDPPTKSETDVMRARLAAIKPGMRELAYSKEGVADSARTVKEDTPWQDLGYWHIGRSQIMTGRYGVEEYWHNDQANSMRTNHLDITLQPCFVEVPKPRRKPERPLPAPVSGGLFVGRGSEPVLESRRWEPSLFLERLHEPSERRVRARPLPFLERVQQLPPPPLPDTRVEEEEAPLDWSAGMLGIDHGEVAAVSSGSVLDLAAPVTLSSSGLSEDIGELSEAFPAPSVVVAEEPPPTVVPQTGKKLGAGGGKKKSSGAVSSSGGKGVVGGTLLRADGTVESTAVSML